MRRITVLAIITALPLAGCASNAPQRPAHVARPTPVVRSIAISPADYMATASSTALFIVRASELIAAREGGTGLGQFARQSQSEQLGIGSQLSLAGRRLNLLPSAALLPRHQALLDELSGSADPGVTYVRQMKSVLPQAAVLHRQYQRYGTSPTLRPVAGMAAPVNERELAAIRRF